MTTFIFLSHIIKSFIERRASYIIMNALVTGAINIDNETLLKNILDSIPSGVYATDTKRRIFYWNKRAEIITGWKAEEIIGKSCYTSNLNHIDKCGTELCNLSCPLFDTICQGNINQAHVLVRHKHGYRIPIVVNTHPIYGKDNNIIGGYEIFYEDTTPMRCRLKDTFDKNKEFYDELTLLPNQKYMIDFINYRLIEFDKFDRPFTLVFGNLDNFTEFNKKYGTFNGDRILQNIAFNIKSNYKKIDLIGRWKDDIFIGVFSMITSDTADKVSRKFYEWINNSDIIIDGEKVGVTVSVGVAIVKHGETINELITRVCKLVKEAKKEKNRIVKDF